MTFATIIAFAVGYGLNEARHSATLPLMGNMTLAKSFALWGQLYTLVSWDHENGNRCIGSR